MRHEVFTGPERRRRWSVEQKLAIVEEVGVNGWTVSDVARRHAVGRQNIYHWHRELRHKGLWPRGGEMPMFLPVELEAAKIVDTTTGMKAAAVAEVTIVFANGRQLRCRADLPETELARLLQAIEAP
jgi:transposase